MLMFLHRSSQGLRALTVPRPIARLMLQGWPEAVRREEEIKP